jgi:ankyrin repeat protein
VQELQYILQSQLHTTCDEHGWNALHYAAATHKVKLVQQLLEIGADPAAEDAVCGLTPLHLACMGRVRDGAQMAELLHSRKDIYHLQVGQKSITLALNVIYI